MSDEDPLATLRAHVRAALDTLPIQQRAAYLLSSLDGFDHDAIAFRLGLSVAQVEAALGCAISSIDKVIRGKLNH